MFAIIRVGGKQYRVEKGTQVLVDRLHVEPGDSVEGVEVLMLADGDNVQVGAPTVDVSIGATAVRHHLGKKIRVFKYKAKKNYRRRIGSRPHQTLIRIDSIGDGSSDQTATTQNATPATAPAPATLNQTTPAEQAASAPETTEVVEVVAVVEAPSQEAAVEAIEDVPGVESVEITDAPETTETA